ncbi:hypothetical protein JOM56_014723 [Amanita muscaria]
MCKTHLRIERQDIDPDDTVTYFDVAASTADRLLTFVKHCELDAHLQMAIAAKVQILPLTKQLTNLAGNAWNKTLNGGRAEPEKKVEPQEDDADGGKTKKGKRDKYKGGLVLDPKRGLHDKFILVMDFNSLYPSIIQEWNIDFTTVQPVGEEGEDGEEKIPDPPASEVPQGVLPRLIATLVNRRRQVKSGLLSLIKEYVSIGNEQYDIKQQALKLTANRREILTHARELAESLGLVVVYGDTDSVFVNSGVTELSEALRISAEFKKAVNDSYKLLEIDLDSIFQRLLLLQKKKYAAIKVEDGTRTSVEVKGLDMKRREYCALSKSVSQYVLEQILSGDPTEVVVENIHEYLTTVGENVRSGKVKLDDFFIYKSQPHVQVALRLKAKGGTAKTGDVISYIFCIAEGEDSAKTAQADRAKHPDEVRKSNLQVDYEHYLSQQILPPIERLCEPIEGTDRSRLAECLGLDPQRYRSFTSATSNEVVFASFESQLSDKERFKDAAPFIVRCRGCQGQLSFAPIHESKTILPGSLVIQLEGQIRSWIAKYYEGWMVCDDPVCGNRTRSMSVYGRRCLYPGCRGAVHFEYTDMELFNQLRYFSYLFDGEKAIKSASGSSHAVSVQALVDTNVNLLQTLRNCVERYLDQSGRRWVDLRVVAYYRYFWRKIRVSVAYPGKETLMLAKAARENKILESLRAHLQNYLPRLCQWMSRGGKLESLRLKTPRNFPAILTYAFST